MGKKEEKKEAKFEPVMKGSPMKRRMALKINSASFSSSGRSFSKDCVSDDYEIG